MRDASFESASGPRACYQPSGLVNGRRLALGAVGIVVVGLLAGLTLVLFNKIGAYFVILVPIVHAAAVGGAAWGIARWSECRNRLWAFLLGACGGVVMYLSYYHFDWLTLVGWEHIAEIHMLPEVIAWYAQNMVLQGRNGAPQAAGQPAPVMNWSLMAFELLASGGIAGAGAWLAANQPYCEHNGRWMSSEKACLPSGSATLLAQRLTAGDSDLCAGLAVYRSEVDGPHAQAELHYTPNPQGQLAGLVYLTLEEHKAQRGAKEMVASRWQLSARETLAIAAVFQELQSLIAATGESPAPPPGLQPDSAGTTPQPGTATAQRMAMSDPPVMDGLTAVLASILAVGPALTGFGGLLLGAALYQFEEKPSPWLAGGLLLFSLSAMGYSLYDSSLSLRFRAWVLADKLRRRPDRLVDPADSEAWFVEVVPRGNWTAVLFDDATDYAFVRCDPERGLLFEGDRERWILPKAAILACEVEAKTKARQPGEGEGSYGAILTLATPTGTTWEAPLFVLLDGRRKAIGSREAAMRLAAAVRNLMG